MAAPDEPTGPRDPDLDLVARVVGREQLDDAMRDGARLLARETDDYAAVFLADGREPLREYWSAGPERPDALRAAFKRAALEAARTGEPVDTDPLAPEGTRGRAIPLRAEGMTLGAICLSWRAGASSTDAVRLARVHAYTAILAAKAAMHEEIARHRAQRARDERWFKTLDGHLRVLDRERQKFAAVVNQTDAFLFTTDLERTIRWTNRAMADLLPPEDGGSWIGKSCASLCSHLGTCGSCPVARSQDGTVTHSEVRARIRGVPGLLYLTALPIRGHSGTTEEVLVMLQDLTGLETLRRSESRDRPLHERHANGILMAHGTRAGTELPVGSETVLLAEDEPGVRAVAKELLELQGYRVLEASNGVDALQIEARHPGPIHLLLTDVVMPRMGGRELAERFTSRRPGIRLLFVSGYTDDAALRDLVRHRDTPFLQKPYTLEALARAVRNALDGRPGHSSPSALGDPERRR